MNKKIMVIDDDKDILQILQFAFKQDGYEVESASDGPEAINKLRAGSIITPVIVSDIMMPNMNGLELLRIIKNEHPDTLFIMLTAHSSADFAIKSLNEGAFAYLTKPLNIDELRSILRNAFEKYRLQEENKLLLNELQKAKEYSDTIVHEMVYTLIATDDRGSIKKINKAMEKFLGYSEEELIGKPLSSILGSKFQENMFVEMVEAGQVKDFQVVFIAKNAREINTYFTGTVMKDSSGKVIGLLGTGKV